MVKPIGREAETPSDIFLKLVRVAGEDILVGGQALALWVEHYGIAVPEGVAAISRDVDFLTDSTTSNDSVTRYAKALHGKTFFPSRRAVTAYRADASFQVMHELHVLRSRLINLHRLKEKQNEKGEMQLRLAIDVAREFLREEAAKHHVENIGNGRGPLQPLFKEITLLASDDAGQKVTKRHGIHVADALDPSLIPAGPFWERQWPRLAKLMSPPYRALFVPPQAQRDD